MLEKGAKASASEASERGITAGCLSSVVLKLLAELDDVLCMGKLFDAMMAAVKIQEYRSRLYVLRLLLSGCPLTGWRLLRHLVAWSPTPPAEPRAPMWTAPRVASRWTFSCACWGPGSCGRMARPGPRRPVG